MKSFVINSKHVNVGGIDYQTGSIIGCEVYSDMCDKLNIRIFNKTNEKYNIILSKDEATCLTTAIQKLYEVEESDQLEMF